MELVDHFVVWQIHDKHGFHVLTGTYHSYAEFDLEQLPNGWGSDRVIYNVQETMKDKEEWSMDGYQFTYQAYAIYEDKTIKPCGLW